MQKALIYCRVSSERQKNEGHGLESQEHRCREYSNQKGYEVEKVFGDSFSGGGDYLKRPAMSQMLDYMDAKPYNSYVVVFDDLKRLARDTEQHLKLKKALQLRRAKVECPNFVFTDSPEGKYVETIMAAGAELEREQNRRQVMQKMKARIEMGYWPFPSLPVGYKHKKITVSSNSIATPVEPQAHVVKEALEGFASGRFQEQVDVQRFLKDRKLNGDKPVYLEQVKRILSESLFFSGYVEYKPWEVSLRKGQHEPLISLEVHEKIKEKLNGKVRTHVKKFLNPDFPLRKFVVCSGCGRHQTGSHSRGRNGRQPYYWCNTAGCSERYKAIRRDNIHTEFEEILKRIKPSEEVLTLTKVIVKNVWQKKEGEMLSKRKEMINELSKIVSERERLLERLTKAIDENVISVYENKLSETAEKELVLKSSISSFDEHKPNIETALNIVFDFLENPLIQWQKGDIHRKKLVLNLIFEQNLAYSRKNGFETAILSLPLRVFTLPKAQKSCLVEM